MNKTLALIILFLISATVQAGVLNVGSGYVARGTIKWNEGCATTYAIYFHQMDNMPVIKAA
jgi:hypothetical protein